MIVLKPPTPLPVPVNNINIVPQSVFLAGSIEMGAAVDWQEKATQLFKESGSIKYVFNPRRDNWDSSWEQSIHNKNFAEQVNWELDALDMASNIIFFFDPNTKSPITLMELGNMLAKCSYKCFVCCPPGFWRRGNVEIMCSRYKVINYASLEDAVKGVIGCGF